MDDDYSPEKEKEIEQELIRFTKYLLFHHNLKLSDIADYFESASLAFRLTGITDAAGFLARYQVLSDKPTEMQDLDVK